MTSGRKSRSAAWRLSAGRTSLRNAKPPRIPPYVQSLLDAGPLSRSPASGPARDAHPNNVLDGVEGRRLSRQLGADIGLSLVRYRSVVEALRSCLVLRS